LVRGGCILVADAFFGCRSGRRRDRGAFRDGRQWPPAPHDLAY